MTAYTGVDPGKGSGAVVQLGANARAVEGFAAYQHMTGRKGREDAWRLRWWLVGEGFEPGLASDEYTTYSAMCQKLERYSSWTLKHFGHDESTATVEKIFVPTWTAKKQRLTKGGRVRKTNLQHSIVTAETAGALISRLEPLTGCSVVRVLANTWRPSCAGIPARTDAKVAGKLAVKYAQARFLWPVWPGKLLTKEELEAVCEAAFIGLYGKRYGAWTGRRR